jgi:RND family efflux transporter MFP subunit
MKGYSNLCVAAMSICLFAACSSKKGTKTQEKIISVRVMEIGAATIASERNYVGTVEESAAVSLSFSSMGTVEQVFVSEGQKVGKGQLLATLNATTAQNAYDVALAKLAQAQDAYDRLAKVHDNGSLSEIKFVEVETGLQQAKSLTAAARKNLDDCRLYAPRSGVITARNIEAGSSANPVQAAFKLVAVDRVKVKIAVPENEIGKISEGQTANVVVPALDNASFSGKIEMKGVEANALSHTYEVKIGVDNNAGTKNVSLLPGMVCRVMIAGDARTGIVVPNRAVQISTDGRRFVWLADNGIAKRCFVTVGNLTDYGVTIEEGLSAGKQIIVEGYTKVGEGMKISISKH